MDIFTLNAWPLNDEGTDTSPASPAIIQTDLVARYAAVLSVSEDLVARYATLVTVTRDLLARYSNSDVSVDLTARYATLLPVTRDLVARYATSLTVLDSQGNPVTYADSLLCGCNAPYTASITGTGGNLPASNLQLTLRESAPASWTLTVEDPTGTLIPDGGNTGIDGNSIAITGSFEGNLSGTDPNNPPKFVVSSIGYSERMQLSVTSAGATLDFVGVPTHYGWTMNRSGLFTLTSRGTDQSATLFMEAQNLQTIRSSFTSQTTARQAATDILTDYGLVGDLTLMDDYVIPVFHRQNKKPIDMLREILEVTMDEWQMINGLFTVYYPQFTGSQFTYDDTVNCIDEVSLERANGNVINAVVVTRAKESGFQKPIDTTVYNEYGQSFSTPLSNVQHKNLQQNLGQFSDFQWFSGKTLVAVTELRFLDPTTFPISVLTGARNNITSVKFLWGDPGGNNPILPDSVLTPFGQIQFYGATATNPWANEDPNLPNSLTYFNQASILQRGLYKRELPPNPLIPDKAHMDLLGQRYLERYSRESNLLRLKVPLNPMLRPGNSITYKNHRLGFTGVFYVTQVTHNFSDSEKARYTAISGRQYLT